jgi:hypothetical protein
MQNRLYELLLKLPKREMPVEELVELKTSLGKTRTKDNAPFVDTLTGVIDKIQVEQVGDKQIMVDYNASIATLIRRVNEQSLPSRRVYALTFISAIIEGLELPVEDQIAVLETVKLITFLDRYLTMKVTKVVGNAKRTGSGRKGKDSGQDPQVRE